MMSDMPRHEMTVRHWLALICICILFSGCGYGEVSPTAYKQATALYSICNRKDATRLEEFATGLQQATEAGEITERESEWLMDIVQKGRQENWEPAMKMCRRMMEDQVQ